LESLSPLAVLGRGYSITQRLADGQPIRSAAELLIDEQVLTRLAQGQFISRVQELDQAGKDFPE
jgi:exodeoxyribonuclease VII large subunit